MSKVVWEVTKSVSWRSAVSGAQVLALVEENDQGHTRFKRYVGGELKQCLNHDVESLFEQVSAIASTQPEYTA
jgi:hypothetical protein